MGLPDLYIVRTFFIILLLLLVFSPFSVDVDQPIADFFPFFIERISQDTSTAMPVGTSGPQTREFDGHLRLPQASQFCHVLTAARLISHRSATGTWILEWVRADAYYHDLDDCYDRGYMGVG